MGSDPRGINYPDDPELRNLLADEIAKIQNQPERRETAARSEKWNEYVADVVARLRSKQSEKIAQAVEQGNVQFPPGKEEIISRMNLKEPDFAVTEAKVTRIEENFLEVEWGTKSAGFGTTSLWIRRSTDGRLYIDSEHMSRDFIKSVFAKLVDGAVFDTDKE